MKKFLFAILIISLINNLSAQFVAIVQVDQDIPGLCNKNKVYSILSLTGGEDPVCPLSDNQIQTRLNKEVIFPTDSASSYKAEGMVDIWISCNGKMVLCEMDKNTTSPDIDQQIVAIFSSLGTWKAGKYNGKNVDSMVIFSFTIENGQFKVK